MRLENVFLSVRPIVLSLARSTIWQFDDFLFEQAQAPFGVTCRRRPTCSAINFASATPSKIRGRAEFALYLRVRTDSNPSSTNCRRVRWTVAMPTSSAAAIGPSLHPSPASDTSAFSRMRAFVKSWAERLPLWIRSFRCARFLRAQPYDILLDGNVLRGHESPPAFGRRSDSENCIKFNDVSD